METKRINMNVDYKNVKVFTEYNVDKLNYPLIVSIPHSGTYFPPEFLQNVCFDEKNLRHNEDIFVDELLKGVIERGLPTIKMEITRTFIDLNRDRLELDPQMFYNYPKDKEILYDKHCRVGLGVVHRINYKRENIYNGLLDYHEVEARLKNVYDVFHDRLLQLVNKCIRKFGFCLVLDCHSMPSKICTIVDSRKGIDICLGNLFNQSCPSEMGDLLATQFWNHNYSVEFNCPYSGAFITFNYCQPRKKMYTLQLEINRGLYADEEKLQKSEDFYAVAEDVSNAVVTFAENLQRMRF